MKLALISLSLLLCFASATLAQTTDPQTQKLLAQAAKNGNAVASEITVSSSVHVQAVLIPQVDAKRIFGDEIANNYAVIQLIVGNKSPTAALIIHGVFIDYRDWPLSGATPTAMILDSKGDKYQAPSFPSQVASEEYRVVRGQLLDAQTDTFRNRFMRFLTLAGNLAGAFTFSLNEEGIIKGIAAATGVGIPGLATAWPDRTVDQLNRVSDLGFRANKLVPKESSEIIVCFFPIDRFLTPGFRKLFLKSPALFFAPLQMLADKGVAPEAKAAIEPFINGSGITFKMLQTALPCYMQIRHPTVDRLGFEVCLADMGLERYKDLATDPEKFRVKGTRDQFGNLTAVADLTKFKTFMALEFIGTVSLNRVSVTVDGTMAIDVNDVAPRIDEIELKQVPDCGDAGSECFWTLTAANKGLRTIVIHGAYLTGAELKVEGAKPDTITELKKIEEGSTDNELRYSFKLNAPVDNQTKLQFTLTKPGANGATKPLESNTWEYVVAFFPTGPMISSVTVDNAANPKKLTVKGKGFSSTPLSVSLLPQSGDPVTVTPTEGTVTDTTFDIALPTGDDSLHPGCWQVQVKAGKLTSNQSQFFAVPLNATTRVVLDAAERSDKFIFLSGTNLINFSACGKQPLKFTLMTPDGKEPTDLEVKDWNNGSPILTLPEKAKTGDWKVQVAPAFGEASAKPLTVRP